ncbi:DNA adenine methyltransferase YhdJ [Rubripirellula lacrimiformis]|uniref:DNA adenine methyltransferase YhdJ n=1 Tax=Rubripirellula lacrimiformis TaxID=1930273 RepID=A0A517NL14_9BACT|nr:DNA methyltransferase [Rubripirellula lacrimiformis]QDT07826.1 DNA adenine methyltransferase YhdJ [Rubripirellula lacrimiformis]
MLPTNQIHQGSCIDGMAQIETGKVDLVFADPPFNIGYTYDVYDDQREAAEYLEFCEAWIGQAHRILKPDGTFWLAIGDEYAAELKLLSQKLGFHCRSWVIWYYTFGVNCVRGFSRSHTHLFHFVKDREQFTFNGDNPLVRVASARQLVYADKRANSRGRLPDNTWILRPQDSPPGGFATSHDTWFYSRVAGTFKEREGFHGCQMPEQILGRILRISSNPGDVVVDPFGGSGTTLSVAKKLGRQWMGFELSPEYAEHIESRMAQCNIGDPLDGVEDPLGSSPKTSQGRTRTTFKNGRPVIPLDDETRQAIVESFTEASGGHSADFVLCDPKLSTAFSKACRSRKIAGDPRIWNTMLLRLRKSKQLPKAVEKGRRSTWSEMEPFQNAAEIALRLISLDYAMTLDEMLCTPAAMEQFDQLAAMLSPGHSPLDYRWAALSLRKRARTKKFQSAAAEQDSHWQAASAPKSKPIQDCLQAGKSDAGVYEIANDDETIYVGESNQISERLANIAQNDAWQRFSPTRVRIWKVDKEIDRFALRAHLIGRERPLLNSKFLIIEGAGGA